MSLERTSFKLRSDVAFGNLGDGSKPRGQIDSAYAEKAFAGMCSASAPPRSHAVEKFRKRPKLHCDSDAVDTGSVGPMGERLVDNGKASNASFASNGNATKAVKKVRKPCCIQCLAPLPVDASVGPAPPPAHYAEAVKSSIFARNCPHGPFCHSCRIRIGRRTLPSCICRALVDNWRSEWPSPVSASTEASGVERKKEGREGDQSRRAQRSAKIQPKASQGTDGEPSLRQAMRASGLKPKAPDLAEPQSENLVRLPGYGTSGTGDAGSLQLAKNTATETNEDTKLKETMASKESVKKHADANLKEAKVSKETVKKHEGCEAKPRQLTAEELQSIRELRKSRDSLTAAEAADEAGTDSAVAFSLSPPRDNRLSEAAETQSSEQNLTETRSFKRAPRERQGDRGKQHMKDQDDEEDLTVVSALNLQNPVSRVSKPTFSVQLRREPTLPEKSCSKRRKTSTGKAPRICVGDEDEEESC